MRAALARNLQTLRRKWIEPALPLGQMRLAAQAYPAYLADWRRYRAMPGAEPLRFDESYPCLFDRSAGTPFNTHYTYQAVWALDGIRRSAVAHHVDVGSQIGFVAMLSAICEVSFLDIRPAGVGLAGFHEAAGDILALPFADRSLRSLSCMHVAEHIGLGRYGDPLNPAGTREAAAELARVLAPGGRLYFSLPIGRARVCYNAHRVHTPQQILGYFAGLELLRCGAVDDAGRFHPQLDRRAFEGYAHASYACGLFEFTRS
jgi:SAM-dependent methyltransferase